MDKKSKVIPAAEREAFTVAELAEAYRLSRATLYNLWKDGCGPKRMRVRGRVLVSRDAAEHWRRHLEADK
jgi:predicted DNA-binding transcriptional regulator AlpA